MKRNFSKSSSASSFLIEIIIVLLFFALSSSVILVMFVRADGQSNATKNTNYAILSAQYAAESIRGSSGEPSAALQSTYPHLREEGGVFTQPLDDLLQPSSQGSGKMEVVFSEETTDAGRIVSAVIRISDSKDVLYSLNVSTYVPKEAAQ